tara:strand:+ start:1738 stop:2832 length:1095 start_codon:yes stop_codon:yes gene_type:complete
MYYNPVKVVESNNWEEQCRKFQKKLGIQSPLIITSNGNLKRQNLSNVFDYSSILHNIEPNPTFNSCQMKINHSAKLKFDGVIAIGGGSVMDLAKVIMASKGTGIVNIDQLLKISTPFAYKIPSIFIPTTHGTGSEVTMWATIWDMKGRKKQSISNIDLYPDVAILDGTLTLSLPLDLSIISVLDALSHSFEAIWNKNANPKSTNYAIEAIYLILQNINRLEKQINNIQLRNILLKASNIAGLAFSNTKTAAAHSISYPLTIKYGIPHGIASSLTLLPLLQINKVSIEDELNLLIKKLKLDNLSEVENSVRKIPGDILNFKLRSWEVNQSDLLLLVESSFTKGRMDNNIVDLSKDQVLQILEVIY